MHAATPSMLPALVHAHMRGQGGEAGEQLSPKVLPLHVCMYVNHASVSVCI